MLLIILCMVTILHVISCKDSFSSGNEKEKKVSVCFEGRGSSENDVMDSIQDILEKKIAVKMMSASDS